MAAELAELAKRARLASALVCSHDALVLAYTGMDQEHAERSAATFATLFSTAASYSRLLSTGDVERVVLRCADGPMVMLPITSCTCLLAAMPDDQALITGAGACGEFADAVAPLLPQELPRTVGGMRVHRSPVSKEAA
ncbi:roadblock/LC7 domain-containing protein [Nocardiopsis alborubida]|uniref:Roadblock/LC7 domain-containing protein n=1 Tax=Nocardiopsis alborubida TaxID=146802 RepID=A0A7X6MCV1_9ACTN|nr:roadblock/LC7 domain-containing protein [Nocardiopsis alborubida]NKY99093.1 roadblock/LC7 domain-containing protein [Nocardiopsis alborubida]